MITRRVFLILLLCSSSVYAQGRPDFSGIFFRTGVLEGHHGKKQDLRPEVAPPLVLVVSQTAKLLGVTATQNGATITSSYRLDGTESRNSGYNGVQTVDRAKFKNQKLLIESSVVAISGTVINVGGLHVKQTWEMASDRQTLTIRTTFPFQGHLGNEIYERMPTFDVASAKAEAASEMNKCNTLPLFLTNQVQVQRQYSGESFLSFTSFQQFNRRVSFTAHLEGSFFQKLVRIDGPGGGKFFKNGQRVETFPESVRLEVEPWVFDYSRWDPHLFLMAPWPSKIPEEFLELRFHLRWTGSESRDLGEVRSKLITEVWPELRLPWKWYTLEVPAKNVSLTDNLEIRILSSAGKQLGCISGHI